MRLSGRRCIMAAITLLILLVGVGGEAAVPSLMNYQGRLTDNSGAPVPDGDYSVAFGIYTTPTGGSPIWSEVHNVSAANGLISVMLGSITPLTADIFSTPETYISLQIGANPEQLPRQRFVTSAYSFNSINSDSVEWSGIKGIPAGFADGVDDGGIGDAVLSADQTFTGTNRFDGLIEVGDNGPRISNDQIKIGPTAGGSASTISLVKTHDSPTYKNGLYSLISNSGVGKVVAFSIEAAAEASGNVNAAPTTAIYGNSISDNDERIGLYGSSRIFTGNALETGTSLGVLGRGYQGFYASGVDGYASSAIFCYGLRGTASSSDNQGYGALCRADSSGSTGYGVYADAFDNGGAGFGVYAYAHLNNNSSYGVYGRASSNTGTGYGVYGYAINNSGTNWAGYFNGNVNVTGTVTSPAKLITIDHPLDPANKVLFESVVESPEMLRHLSGNVILDDAGESVVRLPEWFEVANRDFRYQLTCVGGYAPVYVGSEVSDNSFSIAGGTPGLKVSWEITAIRDDAYAKANPMMVDREKQAEQVGKYLHPAVFGLPEESGVDFEATQIGLAPDAD